MNIAALLALLKGDMNNALVASTPGGIERQEADGQRVFVSNSVLPLDMGRNTKEQFEKLGIIFGKTIDDIFVDVQLPVGWSKEATDHSMWSNVLDEQGRKRVSVFYKAAFYDRNAHMRLVTRYNYDVQPMDGWEDPEYRTKEWCCVVKDADIIIWKSELLESEPNYEQDKNKWRTWYDAKQDLDNVGKEYLDVRFPNWQDPVAYWD